MGFIWFFIDLFLNTLHVIKFFLLCFFYMFVFSLAIFFFPISIPYVIYKQKKVTSNYNEDKIKYINFINTLELGEKRSTVLRKINRFKRENKCFMGKKLLYSFGTVSLSDRFLGNSYTSYKVVFKFKRGRLKSLKRGEYNTTVTYDYY